MSQPTEPLLLARVRVDGPGTDVAGVLALPGAGPRFYWSALDGQMALAAVGAVTERVAEGPARLAALGAGRSTAAVIEDVSGEVAAAGEVPAWPWLGGFGFFDTRPTGPWTGFPAAWLFRPRVWALGIREATYLSVGGRAGSGADQLESARRMVEALRGVAVVDPEGRLGPTRPAPPAPGSTHPSGRPVVLPPAERLALLDRLRWAVTAVRRGVLRKVVVAAHTVVDSPVTPEEALGRLRMSQPGACHYYLSPRPGLALVGATPERLLAVRGAALSTMALAGSAPRHADRERDERLGLALLNSAKDRAEHDLVVQDIRRQLGPSVVSLRIPEAPRLRGLATIQHLETLIEGDLAGQGDILDLAHRLHPTPALGGMPRAPALATIRRLEGPVRGWYGGAVGWVGSNGDGDLSVAIRCLLFHDGQATAFAGAGIVADSDPERELAEIELKLAVSLAAIGGV